MLRRFLPFRGPAFISQAFAVAVASVALASSGDAAPLELKQNDRIVLIGNTLAERMQHMGHFETLLHSRFPQLNLVVRNLAWSADELTLKPRSARFGNQESYLNKHKANVILAFFGYNESFAGKKGLSKFESDLDRFVRNAKSKKYNGKTPPRIAIVSPIAFENSKSPNLPTGSAQNTNIGLYTAVMKKIAKQHDVTFVDLFTPTKQLMDAAQKKLTFNGCHLTDYGYSQLAPVLDRGLFGGDPAAKAGTPQYEALRAEVNEKSLQHWYDYRAVNGFYIYGGRSNLWKNKQVMETERRKLADMAAVRDGRIWKVAQGQSVPKTIDDSKTTKLMDVSTNFRGKITILKPEDELKTFTLQEGYQINLFASEVDFPELGNPVQMTFDAQGRLWVCTMSSYPQYLPPHPVDDKLLILEDTDGDGRADRRTVFAGGLHIPTGFELGDGGVYIAQQPNVLFLKDTNGDDKADTKEIVLHGFDSADSHHSISAFTWGPGGSLYFQEGTFHHSQVETPYGPTRVKNAGIFRYEPRTAHLDVFVSYSFHNPWGHVFDRWGQNFVADASDGANYYGTAFSGDVDYPKKHRRMKQYLKKQWRPTAGCEIVASRHFPDEAQGNMLLNNCIGFLGIMQYKLKDDGSGFHADPVDPLLRSSDPNFRPIDIQFGPDGALYIVDWHNPLVGHMQHSIRDPNRDHAHGRIWRISHKTRPLVKKPKIAGESIANLLEQLKTYEDRTRYRTRIELRNHDSNKVVAAVGRWVAALDKNDAQFEHNRLEALWVLQHHNSVDEGLLKTVLRSDDYRARAAATRVLCYWRDRVKKPLDLLRTQVNDKHPRVRLEAVRALSFFDSDDATFVVLESLAHPQDAYLEYTTRETMDVLDARAKARKK